MTIHKKIPLCSTKYILHSGESRHFPTFGIQIVQFSKLHFLKILAYYACSSTYSVILVASLPAVFRYVEHSALKIGKKYNFKCLFARLPQRQTVRQIALFGGFGSTL